MVQQISTAISDAVLAIIAMRAALGLLSISFLTALGFGLLAAVASVGTVRFVQASPSWTVVDWHKYLSWLTGALGLPCVAAGYFRQEGVTHISNLLLAGGIALVALRRHLSPRMLGDGANALAGCGMVALLLDALWRLHLYVSMGAACFIVAAVAVGTEGNMSGMKRVDVFHYLLAVSVILLTVGFNSSETPIFYRG